MGTNAKQIATRSDVDNKRVNAFITSTRCPTKADIEKVEFLEVNNRTGSMSLSPLETSNIGWNNDIEIEVNAPGGSNWSNYITNNNIFISNNAVYTSIYASAGRSGSEISNLEFRGSWPSSSADAKKYALYYFSATNLPVGKNCSLVTNSTIKIIQNDSITSAGGAVETYANNMTWTVGYMIVDSEDRNITTVTPTSYSSNYVSRTINFVPTTSTVNIYCIVVYLDASFYGISDSTNCTGFKISVADKISYTESYYDYDYKLAQYQDISHKSGATFTIYYGIWNNKSSNAKLDTLKVQIKKTTDTSWTDIGSTSLPSSLNSSTTGSVTCTLPSNFDPTVSYDLRVTAGQTTYNQNWKYRWGNSSTLTSSGYTWTSFSSSAKTGVCGPTSLNNANSTSVLAHYSYPTIPGSHRGRSTTYAALFQIT